MGQHIGTSWYTNQNITLDTQKPKRDEHQAVCQRNDQISTDKN